MSKKTEKKKKNAPFFVTILGVMALTLTALNAIRFGTALAQWQLIQDFMPKPGPLYIALTGFIWAFGWFLVYLSVEFRLKFWRVVIMPVPFFYIFYFWLDRFILQNSVIRTNTKFSAIVTFVFLAFVIILFAFPKSRAYFTDEDLSPMS